MYVQVITGVVVNMKELKYIVFKDLGQDGWIYDEYDANISGYHEMMKYIMNDIPALNRGEVRIFKGVQLEVEPVIKIHDVDVTFNDRE